MAQPHDGVYLDWHVQDEETVVISSLVVHSQRRNGTGTKVFREWEASLPPQFTKIELWAISEDAIAFWTAMGFAEHPEPGLEDDSELRMIKRVNRPAIEAVPNPSGPSM